MNEKTKKSRKIKPFTDDGFLNEDYLFHAIGYSEREEINIATPDWAKERREKTKQKRRWF